MLRALLNPGRRQEAKPAGLPLGWPTEKGGRAPPPPVPLSEAVVGAGPGSGLPWFPLGFFVFGYSICMTDLSKPRRKEPGTLSRSALIL